MSFISLDPDFIIDRTEMKLPYLDVVMNAQPNAVLLHPKESKLNYSHPMRA